MNFNGSKPTPEPVAEPKKNNNRTTAGIVIAVVFATVGAIGIIHQVQIMQDNMEGFSSSSSYKPSVQEVRQRCVETLRDMLDTEPPKLSVNICIGTVLGELNK